MLKQINESELERLYQQYIKQGYKDRWAKVKAELKYSELMDGFVVNEPGIGQVVYKGD
jgi:hypothetical protein